MTSDDIHGVIVPMLTPFDASGKIDAGAVSQLVDYLIERGVHGLFPAGTTGEGPLLSLEERRLIAELTVRASQGRVPVIVHTGALTTRDTLDLTVHARDIGADAAAIIPPFFYRLTDGALAAHVESVAHAVPEFPIFLYNNPAVTPNSLSADLVLSLAKRLRNLAGLKDSSGSLTTLFACHTHLHSRFMTAVGSDGLILPAIAMGLSGCISGNANVFPELVVDLYREARASNLVAARELQQRLDIVRRILRDGSDLSLFKGILARRGLPVGSVRAPLPQASEGTIDECVEALSRYDLVLSRI